MKKIIYYFVVFAGLSVFCFSSITVASNPPAIPLFVYGDVSIDGVGAPVGTIVKAFNGSNEVASASITAIGKYYFDIPAENVGSTLIYKVNDIVVTSKVCANPTITSVDKIDLVVSSFFAAPSGLTISSSGTTGANLSWTASSGATSYNVYRSTNDSSWDSVSVLASTSNISYSDSGLEQGTTYYYRVKAVANSLTSSFSNSAYISIAGSSNSSNNTGGGGGGGGGGGSYTPVTTTSKLSIEAQKVDANNDDKIDILDFNVLMVNWGSTTSGNGGDFNSDNKVDIFDFNMLMVSWTA